MSDDLTVTVSAVDIDAATALVTAAAPNAGGDERQLIIDATALLVTADRLADLIAMMRHPKCKRHSLRITDVKRTTFDSASQKAIVHYETPETWENDPGSITTDWLDVGLASYVAKNAHANIGETCTLWQLNEPAPSDHKAESFRRVIWIAGPKKIELPNGGTTS